MRRINFSPPPAALIVSVLALVAALVGTAVAQPSAKKVTTKKVKKIANQEIEKRLPLTTNDLSDGAVTTGKLAAGAVDGGTMVVVEGPRFSTRAESRWYAAMGGTIVNMTGHPEAILARELGVCYAALALVTDLDAGVEGDHGVTMDEVFRVFAANTERLRGYLLAAVAQLPETPAGCCVA